MKYVLENTGESSRLERQSQSALYDPIVELEGFDVAADHKVLDAGCGSGLVARGIAARHPTSHVSGIDASEARAADARRLAQGLPNVQFRAADLKMPLHERYDRIVCRYVLEHMGEADQAAVVANLVGALNPHGRLRLIDVDGYLLNIYPLTALVEECLGVFSAVKAHDLFVGRKLAQRLVAAGLLDVSWRIQVMQMNEPAALAEETQLITERFQHTLPAMVQVLGSEAKATAFQGEYLALLGRAGTTLFYNKFIATGKKTPPPGPRLKAVS